MIPAPGRIPWKGLSIATLLAGTSLVAAVVLTDPAPATLPWRAGRWLAARSWRIAPGTQQAPPPPSDPSARPAWDGAFDDSGYATRDPLLKADQGPGVTCGDSRLGCRPGGSGDHLSSGKARRAGIRRRCQRRQSRPTFTCFSAPS